jgi:hypothetical protein
MDISFCDKIKNDSDKVLCKDEFISFQAFSEKK